MNSCKTVRIFATALATTTAISSSPSIAIEGFYPGWENDTIKARAFEACMFDYGFNLGESAPEVIKYRKSLSDNDIDHEMMIAFENKNPDWKSRYNLAISEMTEVCYQAAKRLDPSIFKIDYTKGGKHGWKTKAVVDIGMRTCLETDPAMTKSRIERLQASAGANPYDIRNIKLREQRTKGTLLVMDIPSAIKDWGKDSARCKKLLAGLSHNRNRSAPPKTEKTQVRQNSSNSAHVECLQAKDYEGCMRYNNSKGTEGQAADDCDGNFCIIKNRSKDIYGLPKPMGWMSIQNDDGRIFYLSQTYRVPHDGQETRYVGIKRITRFYSSPQAGSSGTFIGGNSASTNCVGYGSSINCTTTGSSPTYLPGRSATPGGVISTRFDSVYDCKDNTFASYKNDELWIGWKAGEAENNFFAQILKNTCDKGSSHIEKLPVLKVKM